MKLASFAPVLLLAMLTGCASTSPAPALRDTSKLVESRSSYATTWLGEEEAADDAKKRVHELLQHDLTLDSAIRVSLLANRSLQASYEEVGIAQADLVQAGLLKNPSVGATYRFPLDPGHGPGIELNAVTDVVQLLTMGTRKGIAEAGLEGTKYRVAEEVIHHVYAVKVAFFALQAAQQSCAMQQIVTDAAEAALDLTRRQYKSGTISELVVASEEALFAQISLDLSRARAEVAMSRERLNRLMGVWGSDTSWQLTAVMPELPKDEVLPSHLESTAVASRFELLAVRKDVELVSYGLALAKNTRWVGDIEAGVSFERKPERISLLGPTMNVDIPIFDQRQAAIARIEAQLRRAKHRETALAVDIRSEVRELSARLSVAREIVEKYRQTLVPQRERVMALSQEQYDAMLLGVFQLLNAKQSEILAYRGFIESLRDYWTLRAELEWKSGGDLRVASPGVTSQSTKEENHVHHAP